jgi:hypothetical protein
MGPRTSTRTLRGCLNWAVLSGLVALAMAGCGSSAYTPPGLVISGSGLQTSKPPWQPEYAHLAQRLHQLGLPPGGKETFHIHALLHIYVNGLLSNLPANIGLDPAKGLESSLHTHDRTGIIQHEPRVWLVVSPNPLSLLRRDRHESGGDHHRSGGAERLRCRAPWQRCEPPVPATADPWILRSRSTELYPMGVC